MNTPEVAPKTTLPGLPVELALGIYDDLQPANYICLSLCNKRLHEIISHRNHSKIYPKTTLPGLPVELVLEICDHLQPANCTCLSLCNKRLHEIIFHRYHGLRPLAEDQKIAFLFLLERDFPLFFACENCEILHLYTDPGICEPIGGNWALGSTDILCGRGPHSKASYLRGFDVLKTHSLPFHSRSRLFYHQVRLAMRRSRYGRIFGISTDSLSYTQVYEYLHPSKIYSDWQVGSSAKDFSDTPTLFSREAQICPEPLGLYLRMQDIAIFEAWSGSNFIQSRFLLGIYEICCHTHIDHLWPEIHELASKEGGSMEYNCTQCNTDCIIEVRNVVPMSKTALVITRWVNLGAGIDHNDPRWKIHSSKHNLYSNLIDTPGSSKLESSRICFEKDAPESWEQLRSRNLSYLWKDRYKEGPPFVQHEPNLWYIPCKDNIGMGGMAIEGWGTSIYGRI